MALPTPHGPPLGVPMLDLGAALMAGICIVLVVAVTMGGVAYLVPVPIVFLGIPSFAIFYSRWRRSVAAREQQDAEAPKVRRIDRPS